MSVITFLFVLALFSGIGSARATESYDLPGVCQGENPIRYLGISKPVGTSRAAEHSLGLKLNNADLEIIRVYCTLRIGNATYAPGECPGGGQRSVDDLSNGTAHLAYVFSRDTMYANTYLSIQAPIRYYSLSLFSRNVAWRASENQTLELKIANDDGSQQCWMESNEHQRKALIHWRVQRTLRDLAHLTNRSLSHLEGTVLIRVDAPKSAFSLWPFPFGKEYTYQACQRSYFPLNVSLENMSSLNYTFCSHWQDIDDTTFIYNEVLQMIMSVIGAITCSTVFFNIWPLLSGHWYYATLHIFRTAFPRPQVHRGGVMRFQVNNVSKSLSSCCEYYHRNGSFPKELSVGYLLQFPDKFDPSIHSPMDTKHKVAIKRAMTLLRFLFHAGPFPYIILLLVLLLVACVLVCLWASFHFGQPYDSRSYLWSRCTHFQHNFYLAGSVATMSVLFLILLFKFIVDFFSRSTVTFAHQYSMNIDRMPDIFEQACGKSFLHEKIATWASLMMMLAAPLVFMPVLANLLLVIGFSVAGIVTYHPTTLLSTIAIVKILLFDVARIGRVNETICPDIADCKVACDAAARQVEEEILTQGAEGLANETECDVSTCVRMFGFSAGESNAETEARHKSLVTRLNSCLTRAFLLLCTSSLAHVFDGNVDMDRHLLQHITVCKSNCTKPNRFQCESPFSCTEAHYGHIRDCLHRKAIERFYRYFFFTLSAIIANATMLFTLEQLIRHISGLANFSSWTELILPGFIALQTLAQYVRSRSRRIEDDRYELLVEAKRILLLLTATCADWQSGRGDVPFKPVEGISSGTGTPNGAASPSGRQFTAVHASSPTSPQTHLLMMCAELNYR